MYTRGCVRLQRFDFHGSKKETGMGLRFRKSINLGGGFKINLSKSGIGYSWGTKGYRVTKTSRGTTRRTYSIPGTGISWVNESGRRNRSKSQNRRNTTRRQDSYRQYQPVLPTRTPGQSYRSTYDDIPERAIQSARIEQFKEAEEGTVSDALERTILLNWIGELLLVGIILIVFHPAFLLIPIAGIVLIVVAHTIGRVNLEYSFDPEKQDEHNRRIGAWQLLAEGKKEWQVLTDKINNNQKINAGANRSLKRAACRIQKGHPYFINTNVETIQIVLANKETLIILPDKVFIVRNRKVGMIDYSDFKISVSSVSFVESESVPDDAQVIGQTWQYVNKNGTPDRRYKNNRQIPICLYGQVFLRSSSGLNVELHISNIQNAKDFAELIV